MIPKKYITWGSSGAVIRELAAYGAERAKVVGPENVYDFTIGSPSIEPPKEFLDAVERLMKTVSPIELRSGGWARERKSGGRKVSDRELRR